MEGKNRKRVDANEEDEEEEEKESWKIGLNE